MAALKRAYADIILNTAKESAARILASERKALRFQQSLFAAKDEAIATMLRLKSLMDSQVMRLYSRLIDLVRDLFDCCCDFCVNELG